MEQSNPPETTSESVNPATVESCGFEVTRSNSEASSLTAENFKYTVHPGLKDKCKAWTNEMHNKYLDYLEASFVEHLQCSMGLLAWCTEQNKIYSNISQKLPANGHKASEQIEFTVLQDGENQKINFQKVPPHLNTAAAESLDALKSPLMHALSGPGKDSCMVSADLREHNEFHSKHKYVKGKRISSFGLASSSEEMHLSYPCYQNSGGSAKEGTGQNFVDEDSEECTTGASRAKRLKTAVEDTSSNDQIVPAG